MDALDFLDKGILKTCQDNNFVLLTNDKDFKNANIDILTGNPYILTS
jgi:predicted nuclease of predicted toxin-antitoxin system